MLPKLDPNSSIKVEHARNAGRRARVDMFLLVTIFNDNTFNIDMIDTGCFVTPPNDIRCENHIEKTSIFPNKYTHRQVNFAEELVKYLEYEFPFDQKGRVLQVNTDRIFEVNRGSTTWKMRPGTRLFIFHRPDEYVCRFMNFLRFQTEECQSQNSYGKAFVTKVDVNTDSVEAMSKAKATDIAPNNRIHSQDIVITK